ncbi:MAG TPA: PP2C family protein-serine/threonine phosphatase [Burkholderiaceae bacterium]|jgi:phosphoserine phosphatase RsbX|nr:PP2C family protein-serine/threonine phosphatase [Burkholderiaceae bacterium]
MEKLKTSNRLRMPTLQWGAAAAPLPGQTESGDRFLVERFADGVLVAVVDALGHGHRAAQVAGQAVETLAHYAQDTVTGLAVRCHALLRQGPGAAMSLASFDWRSQRVTWLGIGNVAGVLVSHSFRPGSRARRMLVRGGLVGGDLPDLDPTSIALAPGDTLIMATDGIDERFDDELPDDLAPQALAEHIFGQFAKSTDDALVVVARYHVTSHEP